MPGSDNNSIMTTTTGAKVEQQLTFVWGLENVDVVLKNASLTNAQKIDFSTGGSGEQLEWTAQISAGQKSDGSAEYLVFSYTFKKILSNLANNFYSQMSLEIKNVRGVTFWTGVSEVNLGAVNVAMRVSGALYLKNLAEAVVREKRWNVHVTFTLYSAKKQSDQIGVPALEQFEGAATGKAREDLRALLKTPVGGDVKIVAGDGEEFSVPKGIFTTRSPYFEAMLRADMSVSKDGVIRLPTVSGKTLEILLVFIMTGELMPEWKEPGVILELTNAAAEYQLPDLLKFTDESLGKVCELGNVVQLYTLANKLGLKTAEEELLKFISEKGTNSPENFNQIMKVISGMDI